LGFEVLGLTNLAQPCDWSGRHLCCSRRVCLGPCHFLFWSCCSVGTRRCNPPCNSYTAIMRLVVAKAYLHSNDTTTSGKAKQPNREVHEHPVVHLQADPLGLVKPYRPANPAVMSASGSAVAAAGQSCALMRYFAPPPQQRAAGPAAAEARPCGWRRRSSHRSAAVADGRGPVVRWFLRPAVAVHHLAAQLRAVHLQPRRTAGCP
jgi:hypothetical protein